MRHDRYEEALLLPERRDWLGMLRRFDPRFRRQAEETGAREAEEYFQALRHGEAARIDPITRRPIRNVELEAEQPPWGVTGRPATGPLPVLVAPESAGEAKAARRAPRDAPTIVTEVVRPAIDADLMRYLEELPGYPEDERKY